MCGACGACRGTPRPTLATFFPRCYSLCIESEAKSSWVSGAGRPGASLWPGPLPAGQASGLRWARPGSISALSSVSGLGTRLLLVGPAQGYRREKDRTGQAGGCAGCRCLLSTHLGAVEMRLLSSTLPCPGPQE